MEVFGEISRADEMLAEGGDNRGVLVRCAPRTEPPGVLRVEVAIRDGSAEGGAG